LVNITKSRLLHGSKMKIICVLIFGCISRFPYNLLVVRFWLLQSRAFGTDFKLFPPCILKRYIRLIYQINELIMYVYILFFLITKNFTNNITKVYITKVSLYIIHTPTRFDIFMLPSGSATYAPYLVTRILKLRLSNYNLINFLKY